MDIERRKKTMRKECVKRHLHLCVYDDNKKREKKKVPESEYHTRYYIIIRTVAKNCHCSFSIIILVTVSLASFALKKNRGIQQGFFS